VAARIDLVREMDGALRPTSSMLDIGDEAKRIGVTEELLANWLASVQLQATVEMNNLFGLGRFLFNEQTIVNAMLTAKRVKSA
jgi:hypothetical protein